MLVKKFSECFKIDERGRPRNWVELSEAKIGELFDTCNSKMLAMLNELDKISLPQTFKQVNDSWSLPISKVLNEEDIDRLKDEILKDIRFSYEDAIARHVSNQKAYKNLFRETHLKELTKETLGCGEARRPQEHY